MIQVSEAARKEVKAYFQGKEIKPVRIFLNQGCGGPQLAMAIDLKQDNDMAFEYDGVEYVMETDLLKEASPVTVDFNGMGFSIGSSLKLSSGCSSCGTKGSCCS